MRDQGADRSGDSVANRAIHRPQKLPFRQTKTSDGLIVNGRPHAGSVCDHLTRSTQSAEDGPKYGLIQVPETQSKASCANSTGCQVVPDSRLRPLPRSARKLPREGESMCRAAREPKYGPERESIPDSKKCTVGDASCERPQGAVLAAEQVV